MINVLTLSRPIALLAVAATTLAQTPAVVGLTPANGTTGLDARDATTFVVTFDQDMDPAQHAVGSPGASQPKIVRESWRDARTFVVQVELEADHVYVLDLSCAGTAGFFSKAGERLAPTPWRLATSGTALADGVATACAAHLFTAIRERYAYRDRLGIDWSQLEHQAAETFTQVKDSAALALRVAEVLATAQDAQMTVYWHDCLVPAHAREAETNYDVRALQRLLPKLDHIGDIGMFGRTADDIGYLFVSSFAREQARSFEQVLQALRGMLECKGIVIDARTNVGGDELLARRLAAFFVEGDRIYAASRERDPGSSGGLADPQDRHVRGNGQPDTFPRPVAVLMGKLNMGNAEAFLLMMRQAPQAILVGESSFGSCGEPKLLQLLPGLTIAMPTAQMLLPDGAMFEGSGIAPQIHVAKRAAQPADGDPVLQEALMRLRSQR